MTPSHVILLKKRGETPLQALEAWKKSHPEYKNIPTSYAGRLDPMAEGKLLVLLGEECKRQHVYTQLDKEYEVEIVLDLKTDSGDVLGLAEYTPKESAPLIREILKALHSEEGCYERAYPVFSSKTVRGIPLFQYYFENRLHEIQIPTHEECMYEVKHLATSRIPAHELKQAISDALAIVPRSDEPSKALGADFRQDAIRTRWQEVFSTVPHRDFVILKVRVTCGSGSYMRTLAERIGNSLGTTAFALSISRTKIGTFTTIGPLKFWSKQY